MIEASQLARMWGVTIERRAPLGIARIRLMAEYQPDPPTITVYTDDLERAMAHEL